MSVSRVKRNCSLNLSPLASTSFADVYLVTVTAFDGLTTSSLTRVYLDWTVMRPPGVSIKADVLVCTQVLHRVRPQGNVPRSSLVVVLSFRVLPTRESRKLLSRR